MPGVDLDLDLPSLSDTMADVVAKLVTALAAIEDDLAAKVVPSELDINAALSMAGNALTDVGSVQMVSGNPPSAAGSVYYHSDGEFYLITSAGTIRMTLNGAMDITDAGGIVGDYGSGNEAVSYDNTSGEYRFTEDTDVWADIVCDDVVLMGENGSVRLGVDDAISTDRQFIFKDLPGSGVSALVYDASESTLESAENTRITNVLKATTLDITGNLRHGEVTYGQLLDGAFGTSGGTLSSAVVGGQPRFTLSTSAQTNIPCRAPLIAGVSRIKSFSVVYENNTAPIMVIHIHSNNGVSFTSPATTTADTSIGGSHTRRTFTLNTPVTVPAHGFAKFLIQDSGTAGLVMTGITTTFDAVA